MEVSTWPLSKGEGVISDFTLRNRYCWPLAIHEAAHAVVGSVLGLPILAVAIDFDQWNGGRRQTVFSAEEWRRDCWFAPRRRGSARASRFDW